jgi:hypothetical protein
LERSSRSPSSVRLAAISTRSHRTVLRGRDETVASLQHQVCDHCGGRFGIAQAAKQVFVRFTPKADRPADVWRSPLSANSGHFALQQTCYSITSDRFHSDKSFRQGCATAVPATQAKAVASKRRFISFLPELPSDRQLAVDLVDERELMDGIDLGAFEAAD